MKNKSGIRETPKKFTHFCSWLESVDSSETFPAGKIGMYSFLVIYPAQIF